MNAAALFRPLLSLMKRIRYSRLFLVVGTLLLVPFVFVLKLQLSGASHDISFNERETHGVGYIEPVRQFLHGVQDHRTYELAVFAGRQEFEAKATQAAEGIDRLISAIDEADRRFGPSIVNGDGKIMSSEAWANLKSKWASLRGAQFSTPEQCEAAHTELVAGTIDFITNVLGNYSNLILDPDLDSYWLMDSYCVRVPVLTETIQQVAGLLDLNKGGLSQENRMGLAALLARTETITGELVANLQIAYSNNASGEVQPAIDGIAQSAASEVHQFVQAVREKALLSENLGMDIATITNRSTQASGRVHELYAAIGPELGKLCQARVDNYQRSYTVGIVVGAVAVSLLIYVLASFYLYLANEITKTLTETQSLRERAEKETESLQGNIMNLLTVVAEVADGDLTRRAQVTEGALGNLADALNQMLDNWVEVLGEALVATHETSSATMQISEVSRRVAEGAASQLSVLQEVDRIVNQITTRILEVSESASTAAQAATRTQESAVSGAESVTNVVHGMEGLRTNVQAGAKKIKNLGDRSMEISSIVATIARISEQTNMLALNAAIEAARAGEQGRGFSVVADEVRKLAERTASATEEISKLVSSIQAETSESVQAIEEQTHAVEQEAHVVTKAGDALLKIQGESTQSAELISDISSTARDQVKIANEAVQSVGRVSRIAEEAATSAAENMRLTGTLDQMARKLSSSMSRFRLQRT